MYYNKRWVILTLLALCCLTVTGRAAADKPKEKTKPDHGSRAKKIEREHWFMDQRAYPLPSIPSGARLRALDQIQSANSSASQVSVDSSAAAASVLWTNIGPAPILNGQVSPLQPVSGRIAAIAVDPTDNTHWLVGSSHGGIWETRNSGQFWRPISDGEASLAMGAVTFAPNNPTIIYAGTGEATFSGDSYSGEGLLKSTNGGANWKLIGTGQFAKRAISDIKVHPTDPDTVIVASSIGIAGRIPTVPPSPPPTGIYKSIDGGVTWLLKLAGFATDIEVNPSDFLLQYGGIYGTGPFRSTDAGNTWSSISGPWNSLQARVGRIELALAPSNPSTLYISIEDASTGSLLGVWRSDDAFAPGPTWRRIIDPPNPGDQYFYDHDLLVDRSNPDQFYLAEITLWGYDGTSWTALGGDYDATVHGRFIHPDQQALAWAGNRLIVGNDGGVWSSIDKGANWTNHNTTLSVSTLYDGSVHPTDPNFALAGSQDNGTERWNGSNAWHLTWFGDGGVSAISKSRPNTDWAASSQGLNIVRTRDGGVNFLPAGNGIDGLGAPFIARFDKCPANDDIFIAGTDNLWRCNDFFSSQSPTWFRNGPEMNSGISAVAFAPSDTNGNTYAFGTARGDLRLTVDGGVTWIDIDRNGQVPNRGITDLAFDTTNRNILYLTLSGFNEATPTQPGHVFRSTNLLSGLPTWANISPPVNIPHNTVALDPADSSVVFVGTDIAMWQSSDAGKSWTFIGPSAGMPNVAVFDIHINRVTSQITAFTHGRGAFVLPMSHEVPELLADLAVTGNVDPDPVLLGGSVLYTLFVANAGPNPALGAYLTNRLDPGLSFVSATSSRGACSQASGVISCAFGVLPSSASATVRIVAQANSLGFMTNTAVVGSSSSDPNRLNNTNKIVSQVRSPLAIIVAVDAHLISEPTATANGGIDPGETVSIGFSLQNIGAGTASNLVATMLPAPGISLINSSQSYGALGPNSAPVARPFSFTATATNGQTITATLHLQDGTDDLGDVSFDFGLHSVFSFKNPNVVQIPDSGSALLYPSTLFVSGIPGSLSKVTVTLSNLTHSFAQDLDILLVAPNGQGILLMSDVGGGNALNNVNLTFDDTANDALPQSAAIISGTYQPTDVDTGDGDLFPAPAPGGPYDLKLSSLYGANPNGTWSLFVFDDTAADGGRISSGWRLNLETLDPVDPAADLLVSAIGSPAQVMAGSNVIYTASVINRGADFATGVTLTSLLPAGSLFVSAQSSQGSCSNNGLTVTCQAGDLGSDGQIDVTIEATLTKSGSLTNIISVQGNQLDPNAPNSITSVQTTVAQAADLGLLMSVDSNPAVVDRNLTFSIVVTNSGPDGATGVVVTNRLPAGVAFVSASASQGPVPTRSGSLITWNAGNIGSLGRAVMSVVVRPSVTGVISNFAGVRAAQPIDLNANNNSAALLVSVIDRAELIAAAGVTLINESFLPRSGGIEAGERVTVSLGLRNIGISNANAIVATLRTNASIVSSTSPQNYGSLVAGGAVAARSFTCVLAGAAGSTVNLVLDLVDGGTSQGSVAFPITLGGVQQFANNAGIAILDKSPANPYPSTIDVSGITGVVRKVTVTLNNLTHGYPDDIDILLVGPDGTATVVMSDCGGPISVSGITLTIDDSAAEPLSDFGPLLSGVYQPTENQSGDVFPAPDFDSADLFLSPAPSGPFPAEMAVFNGHNANGTWSLFVVDDFLSDAGQIGGWSLAFTTVGYPNLPRILSISVESETSQLAIEGQPGDKLVIETSVDLISWTAISTNILTDATFTFSDPSPAAGTARFYRISRQP